MHNRRAFLKQPAAAIASDIATLFAEHDMPKDAFVSTRPGYQYLTGVPEAW